MPNPHNSPVLWGGRGFEKGQVSIRNVAYLLEAMASDTGDSLWRRALERRVLAQPISVGLHHRYVRVRNFRQG
jgi:hypothetical protein